MTRLTTTLLVLALSGCDAPAPDDAGSADAGSADAGSPADSGGRDAGPRPDAGDGLDDVFVYGHSRSTLFELDPRTNTLRVVGEFDCVSLAGSVGDSSGGMTDLAVDRSGAMYGVGRVEDGAQGHSLVRVEPTTGACVLVGAVRLEGAITGVQGLSFVPEGVVDADAEVLVGTDGTGAYFRIDPSTAVATAIGTITASSDLRGGDLVSIAGAQTWAITSANALLTLDLSTGSTVSERALVDAPRDSLGWGLGFWGGTVYAFSFEGRLYAIGTEAASVTEIPIADRPADLSFRGAAVTTAAPVEPPF